MKRWTVLSVITVLHVCCFNLFGQVSVIGHVVDQTGRSLDAATVYINGTTLRKAANNTGDFELKGVRFPCELVVSHLGYQTLKINLDEAPSSLPLLLTLKEKDIALSEVTVQGKDKREELLTLFRENFLGDDTWGDDAILLNYTALVYKTRFNEGTDSISFSGNLLQPNLPESIVKRSLVVQSNEVLQVDLPKLGYKVFVDLDTFSYIRTKKFYNLTTRENVSPTTISQYQGYYSIIPYDSVSKTNQRRFERNRKEAFYNSRMHFCQALYQKKLLQNGYLFLSTKIDSVKKSIVFDWVNLDSCSRYDGKGNLFIYGLEGKRFEVFYLGYMNGSPIDLSKMTSKNPNTYLSISKLNYREPIRSSIYFNNDTCTIRSNGIVPDMGIIFGGGIGQKKVGATLPDDYSPIME